VQLPTLAACGSEALCCRIHRCRTCREFWLVSNRFLARLYASPLVTVAAIRGAPAAAHGATLTAPPLLQPGPQAGHQPMLHPLLPL
jgi:hypothetical protein